MADDNLDQVLPELGLVLTIRPGFCVFKLQKEISEIKGAEIVESVITDHSGMNSFLGQSDLPRGLRNNNPGNLIKTTIPWRGKIHEGADKHFEQFINIEYGIRAMYLDITHDIRKGQDTLHKLILEYAPPHENDTSAYVAFVSQAANIDPVASLVMAIVEEEKMVRLIHAFIQMENGIKQSKLVTPEMVSRGVHMARNR